MTKAPAANSNEMTASAMWTTLNPVVWVWSREMLRMNVTQTKTVQAAKMRR